jgi:hypothetical protein
MNKNQEIKQMHKEFLKVMKEQFLVNLHPKRCDTCTKTGCLFNPNAEEDWKSFVPGSIWTFTQQLGCASHSSSQTDDDNLVWMTPEEEEKRIRQDEQEKTLQDLKEEFLKYVHPDSGAGKVMKTLIKHRTTEQPYDSSDRAVSERKRGDKQL